MQQVIFVNNLERREYLQNCRRIVVKVGSSSLTHPTGKLNFSRMEFLVRQLADLQHQGKELVLVSSGAIGAGMGKLGLKSRPKNIPEKQALAAVGQGILLHMYEKMFAEYGQTVAQVLLTREDVSDRRRFLNARNALMTLLDYGAIPIINENDTVAVEEIKFGENDTLSALVASLVDADLLILLTDIDGLYTANPKVDPSAQLIALVEEITPEIEKLAGGVGSALGSGGMATKINAGKIATNSGVGMIIADCSRPNILLEALSGEPVGTFFTPKGNRLQGRKHWIAFGTAIQGKIYVDDGAKRAIELKGKSLLSTGITAVEGNFEIGNVVNIVNSQGEEFARGIVNYGSRDIQLIQGAQSKDIEKLLGHKDYDEVIHRDNLVLCG
ncbi:MAG: glutamate 5-kinase [Carboxydocellales bacterium]